MPRGLPKRLTALLGSVLLLLTVAGEGFGLHPCPYHLDGSPEPTEAEAVAGGNPSPHHGGDHAGHGADSSDSDSQISAEGDPAEHHSGATPCEHFEACQSAAGAIVAIDLSSVQIRVATIRTKVGVVVAHERSLPTPPSFLLPYSQAPPARG